MPLLIPEKFREESALYWLHCPDAFTKDADECWRWVGPYFYSNTEKYGEYLGHPAHRVSFFIDTDQQPGQMLVCHQCDHTWCVNPSHLFLGTHKDNAADMMSKGRGKHIGRSGEPREKINADDVRAIRASNESIPTLMTRYGLSESWLHQIRSRNAWKKVS